jgi:WD40 repeat protein
MDSLPLQNPSVGTHMFRAATLLDDGNTILASDGLSISRWSINKGLLERVTFKGDSEHLAKIRTVSISPDGQLVATAASNGMIIIWQAGSGEISCGPIEGHTDYDRVFGFSPDSTMVVSSSYDQGVMIRSVETGQSIHGPMEGHEAGVVCVCFRYVLTCSEV